MIAQGASTYRAPGVLERVARRLSRVRMGGVPRAWLKGTYLKLLRIQTRGNGLAATLPHGERVRVLPEYAHLGWNPDEYAAFRSTVRAGGVAVDVGANAGAYTLLLAQWVGPSGSVFAFEPAPSMFSALVQHVRLNGVTDTVCAVRAAVGESDGEAALSISGTSGESRLAGPSDRGPRIMVPTVTLDTFCAREAIVPDFIKIDIEGWELAALRGARSVIGSSGRSLALFVELHPSLWPALGVTRTMFEAELARQNLEMVSLLRHADPWTTEGLCVRLQVR